MGNNENSSNGNQGDNQGHGDEGHGNEGHGNEGPGNEGPGNQNTILIIFIVNGQDQPETVNIHEPLSAARNQALAHSNNTGRPMDEWKILDEKGDPLDPSKKIEEYHFASGVHLTLTLGSGAGG